MSEPAVVTSELLRGWPLPSPDGEGKDSRGSLLVVGGALDTPGAVLLAGLAALRVGAGKLTIATVAPNATALAVEVPEAAVAGLPVTADGAIDPSASDQLADLVADADAVVVGPGMRGPEVTRALVAGLLPAMAASPAMVVLDALGLSCGALEPASHNELSGRLIATPNSTEARFLLAAEQGRDPAKIEIGDETPRDLAELLQGVVAMRSRTAAPDGRQWLDGSGSSGLGTSGSGDVLAGAVGGLAARGADADQATVWGVHLHAEAGERLAARIGRVGFLARELLEELPRVLAELS